jgi:hypothetical protein
MNNRDQEEGPLLQVVARAIPMVNSIFRTSTPPEPARQTTWIVQMKSQWRFPSPRSSAQRAWTDDMRTTTREPYSVRHRC